MTTITRDEIRPGQIVARITTYRVLPRRGKVFELTPINVQWQLQRDRWWVHWCPPFSHPDIHVDGFWIAEEQDRRVAVGDHEWRAFDTWAEAIAWADQKARKVTGR